jgi:hypothetical protein
MARTKRAAAAAAETKIKATLEEMNRCIDEDDNTTQKGAPSNRQHKSIKRKSSIAEVFTTGKKQQGQSSRGGKANKTAKLPKYRRTKASKNGKENDTTTSNSSSSLSNKPTPTFVWDDEEESSQESSEDEENSSSTTKLLSSAMRQRLEHQNRRSSRQVNSAGPMLLSRRMSWKITRTSSPSFSPITAQTISFTPVAHMSTTPVPPRRGGSHRRA